METFGERLKRLRKAAGLTQEDLGNAVGVKWQQIGRWEGEGTQQDFLDRIAGLAKRIGVTPGVLGFGDGADPEWAKSSAALIAKIQEAAAIAAELHGKIAQPAQSPAVQEPPAAQPGVEVETPAAGTTPAGAGTAAPVQATETRRRGRPSRIKADTEPHPAFTPTTPDREWTEADLPDLKVGVFAHMMGLAAGNARTPEIVKLCYFHENGVRHIVADVSGRSMEPRIPAGARVVLEALKPVLTFESGEIADTGAVRSGDVYMVELDDGESTLKRLDISGGIASLRAYNEHEWGVAGVRTLPPGEQFRVLGRYVGIYTGKLPE